MSEPHKFKTHEEANEFKNALALEVHNLLVERTKHLEGKAIWLIQGRVLNALYSHFYGFSIAYAQAEVEKKSEGEL